MTDTIPDHVGREAVRLLNAECDSGAAYGWPSNYTTAPVRAIAKLLMNPPAPMTDPDEEAAKRVIGEWLCHGGLKPHLDASTNLTRATEQMRRERQAWEAGR